MKATTIYSLLLAAGSAIAAPAKRTEQPITISSLSAFQTDQQGYITFTLNDPNYDDSTGANVTWTRPGSPGAGPYTLYTSDRAYYLNFPGGVNDIAVFTLEVQRVKGSETISVTLNDNGNGSAPGTKWSCCSCTSTDDTVEGTVEKCTYDGDITLTPFNS